MICRTSHARLYLTGPRPPVEVREISLPADHHLDRCHFCYSPTTLPRLTLKLSHVRVCEKCRALRNIPISMETIK